MAMTLPVRRVTVGCPLAGYEGWEATVRVNAPVGAFEELSAAAGRFAEARASLCRLVVAWNFVDEDGKALPQPADNPDVFARLPMEVVAWLARAAQEAVEREAVPPNSGAPA